VKLTTGQLDALRNLSRKKAGLEVGWIVIADALGLTDLGFAARNRSGWQITAAGASLLAHLGCTGLSRPVEALRS
jgi:hypothetical protein